MSKLVTFDINADSFTVKGTTYYITPDAIGPDRVKFIIKNSVSLRSGIEFADVCSFVKSLAIEFSQFTLSSNIASFASIYQKLNNFVAHCDNANPQSLTDLQIDSVYNICAMICNTDDENLSVVDLIKIEKKKELWRDNCAFYPFFLLALTQLSASAKSSIIEVMRQNQETFTDLNLQKMDT